MSGNATTEFGNELPAGYRLEEFEIKTVLGSGGFGITYLAMDIDLKRDVVVKENLPFQCAVRDSTRSVRPRTSASSDRDQFEWAMTSFMREAETLSQFDHPNIVRVLRRFEANNTAYFVMPYLPGMSLKHIIDEQVAKGEAFTEAKLKELLYPLLDALQTLHASGVYHRDIKAANIMLVRGHRPILIDFGAARQVISEKSHTIVESAGFTPFEQLQSHGNVGPWSDIYALGATFYTAIHGEPPPRASDRIRRDPIVKLADQYADVYSRPFLEALDWSLMVDETERPQNVEAWREALNGAASGTTTRVARPPDLPTVVKPRSSVTRIPGEDAGTVLRAPTARTQPLSTPQPPQLAPPAEPPKPFPTALVGSIAGGAVAALVLLGILLYFLWPYLAKPGSLHVVTVPPQATVSLAGQPDQPAPADFTKLRPGKYTITVSAPGYDPTTFDVGIKAGAAYPLDAVQLKRTFGTLALQTVPARVNFRLVAKADPSAKEVRGSTPATVSNLPSGAYQLTLASSGLGTRSLDVDVPGHQTASQTIDMIKLNVCQDTSSPAAKALLGQLPVDQLDASAKDSYAALLTQAINAYLHYNMFAQASASADEMRKVGHDTQALDTKISQARDSFEQSTSGQINELISDHRYGAATSKLKALTETLLPEQAGQLTAKYQPALGAYQQQAADAIKQAQAGDPAVGYDALKAFGDQHPDDVQVQLALGQLLTRMPPDHDRLGARVAVFKSFNQQYLGSEDASAFQQMQAHLQGEFDTYNDLLVKVDQAKSGPGGLSHRIQVLRYEIAQNERKAASGQGVDNAFNAVTGLFGQHVHVTSAAESRAAAEREREELNEDLATQQNAQAGAGTAQANFDAFCAQVPW